MSRAHASVISRLFSYEPRRQRPISAPHFYRRIASHAAIVVALIGLSLLLGMGGYVALEGLSWLDAFLNASMLLGGMGPIHTPVTTAGKLFAGCYALYAGLVFIVAAGLLVAPIFHRVLHTLHWDETNQAD